MATLSYRSWILFTIVLCFCTLNTFSKDIAKVTCKAGTFIGKVRTLQTFNTTYRINRFLGVPYAEPPVGERRFRKPVVKEPLTEPYDASQYGASCHGLDMEMEGRRMSGMRIEQAEDCLFLNIFAPQDVEDNEKVPVMMFIHGGGFNIGTSTIYAGDILSAYGRVVVVTINYRLNIWGFLSTGDKASPGNYGLWDQHIAIKWIHENVAAFGGNPDLVTIFGCSAGSASVIYQAMYHGNAGLFKRVIAQSGSITNPWAFNSDPLKAARKVGRLLGCDKHDSSDLVDCIRSKPEEYIVQVMNEDERFIVFPMEFVTTVDGDFVKHPPSELLDENTNTGLKERTYLSSYDLIIGVTANEGLMMITSFVGVHGTEAFTLTKEEFMEREIPKIAHVMFPKGPTDIVEELLLHEYFPFEDPVNDTAVREAFLQMSADYVFNIQAVQTANVHATSANKNTYFYIFEANPSQHLLVAPTWSTKPNHCDDLTFLFGYDSDAGYTAWTMPYTKDPPEEWEIELSKTIITLYSNFARSG